MITNKQRMIAIIPARSGSKGLPDKNIRPLNEKPLLAYSVEAAKKAELFDVVHVSTDSQMYSDIASEYGADQPFLRDEANAADASSSWDAVREVLKKYHEIGQNFDICVLLQPTSPLRTAEDIRKAYDLFVEKKAKSLTSVLELEHPIQWCFALNQSNAIVPFFEEFYQDCRRQDLETAYRENGAIYMVGVKDICNPEFDFYSDKCVAYIMDREKSVDIDTIQDFKLAEFWLKEQAEDTGNEQ